MFARKNMHVEMLKRELNGSIYFIFSHCREWHAKAAEGWMKGATAACGKQCVSCKIHRNGTSLRPFVGQHHKYM